MSIARVRIVQVLPTLERRQVFAFRFNAYGMTPDEQEALANGITTQWMRQNPGVPVQTITDWPNVEELGEKYEPRFPTNRL